MKCSQIQQQFLGMGQTHVARRFQPAEIMKLVVALVIPAFLAGCRLPPGFYNVITALALLGVPAALIVIQPDLGTSLLIAASGLFVLFMAGISWRYIFGALVVAVASAWPAHPSKWRSIFSPIRRALIHRA